MSVNESLARNSYAAAGQSHIVLAENISEAQFALLEKSAPPGCFSATRRAWR
ncbi:hypothetical protein QNH14_15560 [Apirhabdus apintestini]|nr:hypothetical protein QNH14_15560 [Enterobacteriaceae bacterium CA-0114]